MLGISCNFVSHLLQFFHAFTPFFLWCSTFVSHAFPSSHMQAHNSKYEEHAQHSTRQMLIFRTATIKRPELAPLSALGHSNSQIMSKARRRIRHETHNVTLRKLGKKGQFMCDLGKKSGGGGMFLLSRGGVHWQGGPCFFFREGGSIGMGGGWYHVCLQSTPRVASPMHHRSLWFAKEHALGVKLGRR